MPPHISRAYYTGWQSQPVFGIVSGASAARLPPWFSLISPPTGVGKDTVSKPFHQLDFDPYHLLPLDIVCRGRLAFWRYRSQPKQHGRDSIGLLDGWPRHDSGKALHRGAATVPAASFCSHEAFNGPLMREASLERHEECQLDPIRGEVQSAQFCFAPLFELGPVALLLGYDGKQFSHRSGQGCDLLQG